ncbi:MAG: hypothetical protein A2Y17_12245 [Clostridiales bacterium GWF2_38_85]|nr:MAG: hypothetical protein A2Y17_12245 [Clostridiales bacterium GWF2_38_85]
MNDIRRLDIYTVNGALTFDIPTTGEGFADVLSQALSNGMTVVKTVDGTELLLNAMNIVAIEIKDADDETESNTPPT